MNAPRKERVLHYAGYFALHVGHMLRYLAVGDCFNAQRSRAMAEQALVFATDCEVPEDWMGFGGAEDENVDFVRASGESTCRKCQKLYRDHPRSGHKNWQGEPFLRTLCDGRLVKL